MAPSQNESAAKKPPRRATHLPRTGGLFPKHAGHFWDPIQSSGACTPVSTALKCYLHFQGPSCQAVPVWTDLKLNPQLRGEAPGLLPRSGCRGRAVTHQPRHQGSQRATTGLVTKEGQAQRRGSRSAAHQTSQARARTPLCTSCVLPTTPGEDAVLPKSEARRSYRIAEFLQTLTPRATQCPREEDFRTGLPPRALQGDINAVHPPPTPSDSQQPPSHNCGSLPYQLEPSQRRTHMQFTSRSSKAGPAPTMGSWEPAVKGQWDKASWRAEGQRSSRPMGGLR